MSVFLFGHGKGPITKKESQRRSKIAKKHGAEFVVCGGPCVCGHDCPHGECRIKSYWFSGPNLGEPFDSRLAKDVMTEVNA